MHASTQEMGLDGMRALVAQKNYVAALDAIEAWLAEHPDDAQVRFLEGIALTEQNRVDEAITVFAALAAEFPKLPEPHNNLAVLYASRGEYIKARDALLVAINTHPSYATAHENLGDIYAKMAGLAYDKALELDRQNQSAKAKLALMRDLISIPTPAGGSPAPREVSDAPDSEEVVEPGDTEQAVLGALNDWAMAWSAQHVEDYLGAYGPSFRPANGASREQWAASRRGRVTGPRYIRVEIGDARVELLGEGAARVSFVQGYQSDTYADRVRKVVQMVETRGRWLIVDERVAE